MGSVRVYRFDISLNAGDSRQSGRLMAFTADFSVDKILP
jgi:hypothetical protein